MRKKLKDLASLRIALDDIDKNVRFAQTELEKTSEYETIKLLQDSRMALQEIVGNAMKEIKDEIYQLSEPTNFEDRKPFRGIHIKKYTVVEILDENKAKEWTIQNAPSLVTYNKTKLKSAVKSLELDFVDITDEYRVTIASDLSGYLGEE